VALVLNRERLLEFYENNYIEVNIIIRQRATKEWNSVRLRTTWVL